MTWWRTWGKGRREWPWNGICLWMFLEEKEERRKAVSRLFAWWVSHLKVLRVEVGRMAGGRGQLACRRAQHQTFTFKPRLRAERHRFHLWSLPNSSCTLHKHQTHLADVFFLCLSVILLLCLTVHTSDSCNNSGCSPLVPVTWWRLSLYNALLQGRVGQHAWAVSQSPWSPVTNHTGVQSIRCSPEGQGINVSLLPRALQCTHRFC